MGPVDLRAEFPAAGNMGGISPVRYAWSIWGIIHWPAVVSSGWMMLVSNSVSMAEMPGEPVPSLALLTRTRARQRLHSQVGEVQT